MKRVGALIPIDEARALEGNAKENGRSAAAELRLAIRFWLKHQGRRA